MTQLPQMLGHNLPPSDMQIVIERLSDREMDLRTNMKFMKAPDVIADEQEAGVVTDAIKHVKNITKQVSEIHEGVKKPYLECGRLVDAWKKRLETELDVISSGYAKPLNAFLEKRAAEERARQIEAARLERERSESLAAEARAHEEAGIQDTADELMDGAVSAEIMADRMEDKIHTATPSQLAKTRSVMGASASQQLVWCAEIKNISAVDLNALRSYFGMDAIQKAVNAFVRDGGRTLDGVLIMQKSRLSVR